MNLWALYKIPEVESRKSRGEKKRCPLLPGAKRP
jgi:hypothetical protein